MLGLNLIIWCVYKTYGLYNIHTSENSQEHEELWTMDTHIWKEKKCKEQYILPINKACVTNVPQTKQEKKKSPQSYQHPLILFSQQVTQKIQ